MNDPLSHGQRDAGAGPESWYLAQIRPGAASIAERNLIRQGYVVFAPRSWCTRRLHGQFRQALEPLFPGYLFVGGPDVEYKWRAIGHTRGVRRLVQFGSDGPARIPASLVTTLRNRCDENGVISRTFELSAGQKVRIASGPLTKFVATVESLTSERRVWVLLDFLGQPRRVMLDIAQVAPDEFAAPPADA